MRDKVMRDNPMLVCSHSVTVDMVSKVLQRNIRLYTLTDTHSICSCKGQSQTCVLFSSLP